MYRTILHLYKGTLEIYGTKREIKTKQTSKKNINLKKTTTTTTATTKTKYKQTIVIFRLLLLLGS